MMLLNETKLTLWQAFDSPDNKDSDMALTILAEQQDGLLTLTFNRPEKRNALNTETYLALTDALRQAARDEEVHVLLLQGQAGASPPATIWPTLLASTP